MTPVDTGIDSRSSSARTKFHRNPRSVLEGEDTEPTSRLLLTLPPARSVRSVWVGGSVCPAHPERCPPVTGSRSGVPVGTRNASVAPSVVGDFQAGEEDSPSAAHATAAVGSTRASRAWIKVLPALVLLAIILMFVFQNSTTTKVSFATASGRVPLAVALLGSAALGGLLVLALGTVRIAQLRKAIRRSPSDQK